jgi:hypothetical protein
MKMKQLIFLFTLFGTICFIPFQFRFRTNWNVHVGAEFLSSTNVVQIFTINSEINMKFISAIFTPTLFKQSNHSNERPDITYQIVKPQTDGERESPMQQLGCETLTQINNTANEQIRQGIIVKRGTCTFGLFFTHIYIYFHFSIFILFF